MSEVLPNWKDLPVVVLGDVILAVDGNPIMSAGDLIGLLEDHTIGDEVGLIVHRNGETLTIPVVLGPSSSRTGGPVYKSGFPQTSSGPLPQTPSV